MTKMQNFKMQGCAAVLIEQNDKLIALSKNTANLPNIILKNLKDTLDASYGLLNYVGAYKPDSTISDDDIVRLFSRIGRLAVNVAMLEIQITEYRKNRTN